MLKLKKILLFCLFSFCFSCLKAQSWVYHPFPTDSAIWSNSFGILEYPPGWPSVTWPPPHYNWYPPYHYFLSNADTTIGAVIYSKLEIYSGPYQGAMRNDSGKVYFIPTDSVNELLVYDFTVVTGDTVQVWIKQGGFNDFGPVTYNVGNIDSVLVNGIYRKRIWLPVGFWIEGIGSTTGLFVENYPNVSDYAVELSCMSERDTTIYPSYSLGPCSFTVGVNVLSKSNDLLVYPNPTSGSVKVTSDNTLNSLIIADIFGNDVWHSKISSNSFEIDLNGIPAGIYFVRLSDSKGNSLMRKIIKQ
jgi:hypothetical protein